jgi:hypothetical protein
VPGCPSIAVRAPFGLAGIVGILGDVRGDPAIAEFGPKTAESNPLSPASALPWRMCWSARSTDENSLPFRASTQRIVTSAVRGQRITKSPTLPGFLQQPGRSRQWGMLIIEMIGRYQRREISVKEALIEMYLARVSVRQLEDITEALWRICGSPSMVFNLNKKIHATIEALPIPQTIARASIGSAPRL